MVGITEKVRRMMGVIALTVSRMDQIDTQIERERERERDVTQLLNISGRMITANNYRLAYFISGYQFEQPISRCLCVITSLICYEIIQAEITHF